MLYRKELSEAERGFTLVELLIGMTVLSVLSVIFLTFFVTTLRQYLGLQKDGTAFSDLTQQSQRITNVLRGATDVTEATNDSVTVYAYFFPNNNYVSIIRYYLNPTRTTLYADVTPMTANPPSGVPDTA
ncbi:prepilin-type N-terminal cleavage/methylation domain-containing protein, partial [Candidatus Saccharibacteria bacterium]|nr:prepilin-type N-terminal cleavage/methylation domain-containing protein [Candidatus Saccharibacteria bacterium]